MTNCIFSENSAGERGGGMWYYGGHMNDGPAFFTNCVFAGNVAGQEGGGMEATLRASDVTLANCTFHGNRAGELGSAIHCYRHPTIYVPPAPMNIANCILWDDVAGVNGAALALTGLSSLMLQISHSDVQGGAAAIYADSGITFDWGIGNIDADPCFVEPGYWDSNSTPEDANDDFWVNGDYHLSLDSPCIDGGDNNSLPPDIADLDSDGNTTEPTPFDLDSNPRIMDGIVDMGALETIVDAAVSIVLLAEDVIELNLQNGIEISLDVKLDAALQALDDINENNDVAAINSLQAFINAVEAQRGNKIPEADADALIAETLRIIELLNTE